MVDDRVDDSIMMILVRKDEERASKQLITRHSAGFSPAFFFFILVK